MVKVGLVSEDVTMPSSEISVLEYDYMFITMGHDKFLFNSLGYERGVAKIASDVTQIA